MRWILWRWFLAGYAIAPLLLFAIIEHGTKGEPVVLLVAMVPIAWLVAPLGEPVRG